uniref:Uncharacterized protein n=1 Tax=Scytodes thoracica TaxID=1112478 RepID=A0A0A0VCR7_SCYTH|nr:conserved hypothetical protein [Scytodes thoracica]
MLFLHIFKPGTFFLLVRSHCQNVPLHQYTQYGNVFSCCCQLGSF